MMIIKNELTISIYLTMVIMIIGCFSQYGETKEYVKFYNSINGVNLENINEKEYTLRVNKNSKITNYDLKYLPKINNLTMISIESDNITEEGIKYIGLCKDLEMLSLKGAKINDNCVKYLVKLKKLKTLRISENENITDESLKYIGQIERLDTINLSGTNITDKGLAYLKNLKNLTFLNLSKCKNITVESIRYLAENEYLKKEREYDKFTVCYDGTGVRRAEAEKKIKEYGLVMWIETDDDESPYR